MGEDRMFKSNSVWLVLAALLCFEAIPANSQVAAATSTSIPFGNYQGAWKNGSTYAAGSVVIYAGATYFALASNTNTFPSTHPFKWAVLPALPTVVNAIFAGTFTNLGAYPGTPVLEVTVPTSGSYSINATAQVSVDANDTGVFCYISYGARGADSDGDTGGTSNPNKVVLEAQASIADYWGIAGGDQVQLYCFSNSGDASSGVYAAGLNATLYQTALIDSPEIQKINNRPEVRPSFSTTKPK
jgi:hypothetical protein